MLMQLLSLEKETWSLDLGAALILRILLNWFRVISWFRLMIAKCHDFFAVFYLKCHSRHLRKLVQIMIWHWHKVRNARLTSCRRCVFILECRLLLSQNFLLLFYFFSCVTFYFRQSNWSEIEHSEWDETIRDKHSSQTLCEPLTLIRFAIIIAQNTWKQNSCAQSNVRLKRFYWKVF